MNTYKPSHKTLACRRAVERAVRLIGFDSYVLRIVFAQIWNNGREYGRRNP